MANQILRFRRSILLAKIEATPGVDAAPSATTDGVLVENLAIALNPVITETAELTGSLDPQSPIVGGAKCVVSFDVYLKGSGVPGVAPEWGRLMKACNFAEIVTSTPLTATTISAAGPSTIADSANGLAALTVGTPIYESGRTAASDNGEFLVSASSSAALTVTSITGATAGLVTEAAGPSVTLRRGVAGAAASAGSSTGFTAGGAWSATNELYQYMPVLLSGNPVTPAYSFIADYTGGVASLTESFGTPLSNATIAAIPANVLYYPTSAAAPSVTLYIYGDGTLWKFVGAVGDASLSIKSGGAGKLSFKLSGLFAGKTDSAFPATLPSYDPTRPPTWRNGVMSINRGAAAVQTLNLQFGNTVVFPDDPNSTEGFDDPIIVERKITGDIDPLDTLVATRNSVGDLRSGIPRIVHARLLGATGAVAGNRAALTIGQAFHRDVQPGTRDQLRTEKVMFQAVGLDQGAGICLY